jgi:hypothetical protein
LPEVSLRIIVGSLALQVARKSRQNFGLEQSSVRASAGSVVSAPVLFSALMAKTGFLQRPSMRRCPSWVSFPAVALLASLVLAGPSSAQTADEKAWSKAAAAGSVAALRDYLKAFPAAAHAEEAQMRIVDVTLAAPAVPTGKFDGTWLTTVSCPSLGSVRGFTYQFSGAVKAGAYHGEKGAAGERGWYKLDGRIDADGNGAMLANGIIGASAFAAGHSPAGNAYAYHVLATFTAAAGNGKRIEGRVCNLTFVKQ